MSTSNNFNGFVSSDATGGLAAYHPELLLSWI
jgi:hypothetical protein